MFSENRQQKASHSQLKINEGKPNIEMSHQSPWIVDCVKRSFRDRSGAFKSSAASDLNIFSNTKLSLPSVVKSMKCNEREIKSKRNTAHKLNT